MRARLLWTLLLLAAVFSVHGLSCVASESDMAGMSMPAPTAAVADAPESAADMAVMLVQSEPAMAVDAGASTDAPAGHGMAAHALMVCLAVLAGGAGVVLAALAAWLARRQVLAVLPRFTSRLRGVVARAVAYAPAPELSRLCVLRV